MAEPAAPTNGKRAKMTERVGMLIGPAFLVIALWFILTPSKANIPIDEPSVIDTKVIQPVPRRKLNYPPKYVNAGIEMSCDDCHALFDSGAESQRPLRQHKDIVLDHGMNDRCYNCHDRDERELFTLRWGKKTTFDNVPQLCAKCHGPTYRDWQLGMHGRTNGYWDASKGEVKRLVCSQCHNPHSPAYPKFKPLPGPHTLRMGEIRPEHGREIEAEDPLETWSYEHPAEAHESEHTEKSEQNGGEH